MKLSLRRAASGLMRRLGYEVRRLERPSRLVFNKIPGWCSIEEGELLYLIGLMARGRILEVGHFLGRNTSAVCEGIRDSGRAVAFDSYDFGFQTPEEFVAFYRKLYSRSTFDVPDEVQKLVYDRHSTTTEAAREQLGRFGLAQYVNLISGDFAGAEGKEYDVIFCDAMHDLVEIRHNLPHLVRLSAAVCTCTIHDTNAKHADAITSDRSLKLIRIADTLGVFQYTRR